MSQRAKSIAELAGCNRTPRLFMPPLTLPQQFFPPFPRLLTRFFVRILRVRLLSSPHETVAGTLVRHWLIFFPSLLHQLFRLRNRGIHAIIVPAVKAISRAINPR